MLEYLKANNKTNDVVIDGKVNNDELHRFSKSDLRWAENRYKSFQCRKVKKGEIYQFEFGKNFMPEMSYEHRGLIIGIKNKLLYVLPIYSYVESKHKDAYHPVDRPDSQSDEYLLKASEFSCIKHDSILKLNDIRTVSINRILYKHDGRIAPNSDTYKSIEKLVLQKYFAEFYFEYEEDKKEIDVLKEQIAILEEEKIELQKNIESLRQELENSTKEEEK